LIGRRRVLQRALKKAGPVIRFSEHLDATQGEAMFHSCAMGLLSIRREQHALVVVRSETATYGSFKPSLPNGQGRPHRI
jgi:hypothetical protein